MKNLLTLLLLLLLLVGCGSPEQPEGGLIMEEPTDCSALEAKYNDLAGKYASLKVNHKLQKVYLDTLTKDYEAVLSRVDVRGEAYYKSLETEMAQHQLLQEEYAEVWSWLNEVNDRNDITIESDNLTKAERKTFYKGWDLWWETLEK